MKKIEITRLDYKNPTDIGGLKILPTLSSVDEVTDTNEINRISIYFDAIEQANEFVKKFPKYCKGYAYIQEFVFLNDDRTGVTKTFEPCVTFRFNTFWMNQSTGEVNETGVKQRNKVIEILKSI